MEKKKQKFIIPLPSEIDVNSKDDTVSRSIFKQYQETKKRVNSTEKEINEVSGISDLPPALNNSANVAIPEHMVKVVENNDISSNSLCSSHTTNREESKELKEKPPNVFKGSNFSETFAYLKESEYYEQPNTSEKKSSGEEQSQKYKTNSIIVNPRQRGNPILQHIRNVAWEYGDVIPDYVIGQTQCALFLSLRYYNFNPEYIHERLKQLGSRYDLRVLLVLVDIKECHHALKELGKIAILSECTLILSWSPEEAGRYLETFKSYENKPADIIQEKVEGDYLSKITDCLTSVKSVNKTDVITLLSAFGSFKNITEANKEEIALCPGFGLQKAERLQKIFKEPFKKRKRKSLPDSN